ncbi:MAG: response regulator [Tannerellaceae bacterium]|nr:response regulator [Tannerellaceae bacterium]
MRKYILFLFFIMLVPEVEATRIRHIGINEGINGKQTYSIVRDKKGFMWISTRFGLDRYDGETVKNYSFNILDSGTVPARIVTAILDRESQLWAYSDRGAIYRYDEISDEFRLCYEVGSYTQTVYFDRNNHIWYASQNRMGTVRDTICPISNTYLQQQSDRIKEFLNFDEDHLLAVTNKGLIMVHTETGEITEFLSNRFPGGYRVVIESCYFDETSQELWIGTEGNGLFVYHLPDATITPFVDNRLKQHTIREITSYKDSLLLLGTEGLGMWVIEKQARALVDIYNSSSERSNRIHGDAVYNIFADELSDRIWVSTYSGGVNVIDLGANDFRVIRHEQNNPHSLLNDMVSCILQDREGDLWIATANGVSRWGLKREAWTHFFEGSNIITLYEDSRGDIWIAAFSQGVYVMDKKGNIKHHYQSSGDNRSLGSNFIYSIYEDPAGNIWLGGKKGHISRLNRKTGLFDRVHLSQINYITGWKENHILVSTEYGLYSIRTDSLKQTPSPVNKQLASQYVTDIWLESDSIAWIGTYGNSLNRCHLYSGEVECFAKETSELRSEIVYRILPGAGTDLWFSTENGIGKIDRHTGIQEYYPEIDGKQGYMFRQLAGICTRNGTIFLGSYDGIVCFNPGEIRPVDTEARLVLEDFYLFNRKVNSSDPDSPLTSSLDNQPEVKLNYKQHSFSIGFTAIDFHAGKNHRFMWKLEGQDENPVGPVYERIATYTNLSPGNYLFRLWYVDENNRVLDEKRLRFVITPPFWKTPWARLVLVLLMGVAAYVIYEYILFRIRKKESEEKISFFIHTAHDIRTPLTLINGPLNDLLEEIPKDGKSLFLLKTMRENVGKLNQMFSKLLDFQKAYETESELLLEEISLTRYFRDKFNYWHTPAERKQLLLQPEIPDEELLEWIDRDKLDKITDNLLSNALKYTPAGGRVTIRLDILPDEWILTVKDTGIGISRVARKKLFGRFYRAGNAIHTREPGSGLGLLLVKQYVSKCLGTIRVDSVEKKGTSFRIRFPRSLEQLAEHKRIEPGEQEEATLTGHLPEEEDHSNLRILIVEDNDHLREYIKVSLEAYYTVYTAADGREAWKEIFRINPDIVVSDLQMPGMDGFELCRKLKTTMETSHIPIIFLTVMNDKHTVAKGFRLGVDDYIEKPFETSFLRIKINNMIRNRKLLRQKFLGIDPRQENDKEENELNRLFIESATTAIEKNMDNPAFSISELTRELGMSRTLLFSKFKTITGYTPNEYIKIVRFNKAISYFKERKYTINEVAGMVGFEEPAYFSTCFKKIYGKTPSEFIEENITPKD